MVDARLFDEIANNITKLLPTGVGDIKNDVEKNVKAAVQSTLGKLDLVTREEFDVQAQVLSTTRERLKALEQRLAALEETQSDT